jgi:hypothetical protein
MITGKNMCTDTGHYMIQIFEFLGTCTFDLSRNLETCEPKEKSECEKGFKFCL